MTIRKATPADAETLFEIQRSASLAALARVFPPERYPYPDEEIRALWDDRLARSDHRVLVAEREGLPLGAAAVAPCWLNGLYVVPEEWGSGLAIRLHDAAIDALRELGCQQAQLWVLDENRRARRFYERHGWRLNDETRVVPYPPHPLDVSYSLTL